MLVTIKTLPQTKTTYLSILTYLLLLAIRYLSQLKYANIYMSLK
jgi:hypothetical protein